MHVLTVICSHGMEGQRIDRPYVVYVVNGLSVAFESVLLLLSLWTGIEVFYSYATFD